MRKTLSAAVAGLAIVGGVAAIAGTANAQTRYYDPYTGRYVYSQPNTYRAPATPYYYSQPYGYTQPYAQPYAQPYGYNQPYAYNQPYSSYGSNNGLSAGLAVLGSLFGLNTSALSYNGYGYNTPYGAVPVDQYGPDPNGMIAPDGHRIKCKLRRSYDSYYRQTVTRRECR
ncbi:hypothetical protein [Phenylobacterium sp.]|jgi:hypothetical protein|uniref:hypothetical protein n=1 Tax=Phenylobacterium sp. TaxID=1871053 RepID=UPI002F95FE8D